MTDKLDSQVKVATLDEFADTDRKQVRAADGTAVTVLRFGDEFRAYVNRCAHMGGPVGDGVIIGRVEMVLDEEKRCLGERFSEESVNLVCPWHGWEYDLDSGEFIGDRSIRLWSYDVEVRDGEVYLGGRR